MAAKKHQGADRTGALLSSSPSCRGSVASRRRPIRWVNLWALQASHCPAGLLTTLLKSSRF